MGAQDEGRKAAKGRLRAIRMGGRSMGRAVMEQGRRAYWSGEENPYHEGSEAWKMWNRGYNDEGLMALDEG